MKFIETKTTIKINLLEEFISVEGLKKLKKISITAYKKDNMTNGFDDIDYLVNIKEKIKTFQVKEILILIV